MQCPLLWWDFPKMDAISPFMVGFSQNGCNIPFYVKFSTIVLINVHLWHINYTNIESISDYQLLHIFIIVRIYDDTSIYAYCYMCCFSTKSIHYVVGIYLSRTLVIFIYLPDFQLNCCTNGISEWQFDYSMCTCQPRLGNQVLLYIC